MSDLEIFKLGVSLALALKGDNEAIADVRLLLERHPEMFKSMGDLIATIKQTVKNPEIIMDNPRFKNNNEILAAKKIDDKKMVDVIIKNHNGTNVIFHANKSDLRNLKRLERQAVGSENAQSHTAGQAYTGANGMSSILSPTANPIIPQTLLNNLFNAKDINTFASNLVEIIKVSPNNKLSFYDDICKQSKFKTNLMDIDKEKLDKAINNLSINKTGLLEALIKTNLKGFKENLELENHTFLRR